MITHRRYLAQIVSSNVRPGASSLLIALLPVLLLLLTLAAPKIAVADEGGGFSTTSDCRDVPPLTLTLSPTAGSSVSNSAFGLGCHYTVTAAVPEHQSPDTVPLGAHSIDPCQITAVPTSSANGLSLEVRSTHQCPKLTVSVQMFVSPAANSTALGVTSARAEVEGNDIIGLDLFRNTVRAVWQHTLTNVTAYYFYPTTWTTTFTGWTVEFVSNGSYKVNAGLYRGFQLANFHIHIPIIADTRAYTHAQLDSKAGGAFVCTFPLNYFINGYLQLYFNFYCNRY